MNLRRRAVLAVLPIILLTACATAAATTPVNVTATDHPPTATISPAPSASETAKPTYTEIPTPETTAELIPTEPEATVSAMQTLDAVSDTTCGTTQSIDSRSLSPDGQWVAIECHLISTMKRETNTKVFRLDGSTTWNVAFYEIYGRFHAFENGSMRLHHWSKDGNFAYLIPSFCCADVPQDIFFNYFQTGVGLYRLDLKSGKLAVVLPPDPTSVTTGYAFSFSLNDKYLAYLGFENTNEISIYTLQTGHIEKISLHKYDFCGRLKWSADNKKLALICGTYKAEHTQIYAYLWMDSADWVPNLLTKKEATYPENIPTMHWTEDNNLVIDQP